MEYNTDPLDAQGQITNFWEMIRIEVEATKSDQIVFKSQELPLARIKKIMKLDDDVKNMMISAEAPILFAKAAELFIRELTLRAWIHTERNRRRTLHRNDIALAVSDGDTDQFDFLIDIVPRDDSRAHRRNNNNSTMNNTSGSIGETVTVDSSKLANILDGQNIVDISNQANGETIILNGNSVSTTSGTTNTSNGNSGQTVQFITTNSQSQSGASNGQQVQYVLQLPTSSSNTNGAFQVQMLQPGGGVQVSSANDATSLVNGLPPGTVLQQGPNGTLQLVQLISSANTITTPVQSSTNGTTNEESDKQQEQLDSQKLNDQQNSEEIDTKINIQASNSSNNQTIILQTGNDNLVTNDPLAHQQLIYTPAGSNQPVIISLADAIASGLVNEMAAESITEQVEQNPSTCVANTVEISSTSIFPEDQVSNEKSPEPVNQSEIQSSNGQAQDENANQEKARETENDPSDSHENPPNEEENSEIQGVPTDSASVVDQSLPENTPEETESKDIAPPSKNIKVDEDSTEAS